MFFDRLIQTLGRLFGMYTQRTAAEDCRSTAISDRMANAITAWYRLLYGEDVHDGYPARRSSSPTLRPPLPPRSWRSTPARVPEPIM